MKIIANGLTRHRFWGEYSAAFILVFETVEQRDLALPLLNDGIEYGDYHNACGGRSHSNGWRICKDGQGELARALFCDVADPALEILVNRLAEWGAERKKILSMARSIDYGEEFTISIPYEDPAQIQLSLEK